MVDIPFHLHRYIYPVFDGSGTYYLNVRKFSIVNENIKKSILDLCDSIKAALFKNKTLRISKVALHFDLFTLSKRKKIYICYQSYHLLEFLMNHRHPIDTMILGSIINLDHHTLIPITKGFPCISTFIMDANIYLTNELTSAFISMVESNPHFKTFAVGVQKDDNAKNVLKIIESLVKHPNVTEMTLINSMFNDVELLNQACEMISACERIKDIHLIFITGENNSVAKHMYQYWIKHFMVDCEHIQKVKLSNYDDDTRRPDDVIIDVDRHPVIQYLKNNTHVREFCFGTKIFSRNDITKTLKDCNFCLEKFECDFTYHNNNLHSFESFLNKNRISNRNRDTTLFDMMYKNIHLFTFFDKKESSKKQRIQ